MDNILRDIQSGRWLMEETCFQAALPFLMGDVDPSDQEEERVTCAMLNRAGAAVSLDSTSTDEERVLAVHYVEGMITKHQSWYSTGMTTLMANLKHAENDSRVVGHMISMDSGGGQGTNIATVATMIRSLSKPVVVSFNGYAASAAYWIAAAADEIYASEPTDIVGSIGVMTTLVDYTRMYEDRGIRIHHIYADQSSAKNAESRAAKAGEYGPIRKKLLSPMAAVFAEAVARYRPRAVDEDIYQGNIYPATEALEKGLIDGVKPVSEVIARVFELADTAQTITHTLDTHTTMEKKLFPALLTLLAFENLETDKDGGAYLDANSLGLIEATLADANAAAEETSPSLEEKIKGIEMKFQKQHQELTQLTAGVSQLADHLKALAAAPGAEETRVHTKKDTSIEVTDDVLDIDALNAKIAAAVEEGSFAVSH